MFITVYCILGKRGTETRREDNADDQPERSVTVCAWFIRLYSTCVWAIVALVYLLGHRLGPKAHGKSEASGWSGVGFDPFMLK